MLNEQTVNKLHEMRLSGMVEAFRQQQQRDADFCCPAYPGIVRCKEDIPHELAIKSDVSPSTISGILKGKNRNPGIATLDKICRALSISLREFWTSSALSGRPWQPSSSHETSPSDRFQALRDTDKKVRAPQVMHRSIPDKGKNVFAGLVITNLFS